MHLLPSILKPKQTENPQPSEPASKEAARDFETVVTDADFVDVQFRCSFCMRTIDVGRPVFMRNDFPFCTKDCRESGISQTYIDATARERGKIQTALIRLLGRVGRVFSTDNANYETSLDYEEVPAAHLAEGAGALSPAHTVGVVTELQNSAQSVTKQDAVSIPDATSGNTSAGITGLLNRMVTTVSANVLNSPLVRKYTSNPDWYHGIARHSSVATIVNLFGIDAMMEPPRRVSTATDSIHSSPSVTTSNVTSRSESARSSGSGSDSKM